MTVRARPPKVRVKTELNIDAYVRLTNWRMRNLIRGYADAFTILAWVGTILIFAVSLLASQLIDGWLHAATVTILVYGIVTLTVTVIWTFATCLIHDWANKY